ncbi:unnamed protein product [Leptosia nina]|uniref:Major facilitator superfamily (MFS) profile domain-containing protein n=1 Tax=Leptosia nina TaxID=320188 RepID=A0AAV1JLY0_9NEOP
MQGRTIQQILITVGLTLCNITDGFIFGQMSGMLDALTRDDASVKLTVGEISLIAAIINVTCICGFAVVGVATEIFGRRRAISIITSPVILCWIVVYFVEDKTTLLLTRVLVGVSYGGILIISKVSIGEYITPKKRSLYVNVIASGGQLMGTTLGHLLSLAMNWRNVALIGLVPTALSCILPFFWVESPSWLASKGRYEECERAFRALHVLDEDSEKELRLLIALEKRKESVVNVDRSYMAPIKKIIKASRQKYFWKVILLSIIINVYRIAAGRVLFSTLALSIFRDFTGYSNLWGITLLVDGLGIFGALNSCILVSVFNKLRTLIFVFGSLGNFILMFLSGVCYFTENKSEDNTIVWVKASLLALYFLFVNSGAYPVLETLLSEIYPLEAKTFCIFIVGAIAGVLQFLTIKSAPEMFKNIGYDGTFFLFSVIIFMCIAYLWKFMPETKGETLQDIEMFFKADYLPSEEHKEDTVCDSMINKEFMPSVDFKQEDK